MTLHALPSSRIPGNCPRPKPLVPSPPLLVSSHVAGLCRGTTHHPIDQAHPQSRGAPLQLHHKDIAEVLGAGAVAGGGGRGLVLVTRPISWVGKETCHCTLLQQPTPGPETVLTQLLSGWRVWTPSVGSAPVCLWGTSTPPRSCPRTPAPVRGWLVPVAEQWALPTVPPGSLSPATELS